MLDKGRAIGSRRKHAEQRWFEPQYGGAERPDRQQHDLAAQIVTNLNVFFVLVGSVVHLVVALGLKEEVASLPGDHGHQPAK